MEISGNREIGGSRGLKTISANMQRELAALETDAAVFAGREFVEAGRWELRNFPTWSVGEEIDWFADPFGNRTWTWHLQQWAYVPALIAYDRRMKSTAGCMLAVRHAKAWWGQFADRGSAPEMAWHDHGTALRARNILLLVAQLHEHRVRYLDAEADIAFLRWVAVVHAETLLREDFYSVGTNHGLDQSLILFELSQELPGFDVDGGVAECARRRIAYEIGHAFSPDGGHVENSAGYQNYGLVQAQMAIQRLSAYDGVGLDIGLPDAVYDKAALALAFMSRPDGTLPLIGDTAFFKAKDIFSIKKPGTHSTFLYAVNGGREGTPPASTELVLPESGWAMLRSDWKGGADFARAVHIVFKSGFLSTYHRHDDDLGFSLFAFGAEWIIDGGLWKHQPKDPMRIYLRSAAAHSLSAPLGVEASRDLDLVGSKSRIVSHETDGLRSTVTGESGMFVGFHSQRRLTYDRSRHTLRLDDSISPVEDRAMEMVASSLREGRETFVTRFLVPGDKKVTILPEFGMATITGRGRTLTIAMAIVPVRMRLTKGVAKPRPFGWRSVQAGKIEPAWTIEFFHATSSLDTSFALEWE